MGRIAWCVTPPSKGAGGFRTICRKIDALQKRGYINDVYIAPNAESPDSAEVVRTHMATWFGCYPDGVFLCERIKGNYDAMVATAWDTAQFVSEQACGKKLYFVQDYEPLFFPLGYERFRAEESFNLGLQPITIGRWLSLYLSRKIGEFVPYCDFGADLSVYRPLGMEKEKAVCVVYQPEKARRLARLVEEMVQLLMSVDSDLLVYVYGSSIPLFSLDDRVVNLGVISTEECNLLYNKCSCGVSLSGSNPSRIPFEMMAAGLPVIDLALENNKYDFDASLITLVPPKPECLAGAVLSLFGNPSLCSEIAKKEVRWMGSRSSEMEDSMFCDAVVSSIDGSGFGLPPVKRVGSPEFRGLVSSVQRELDSFRERLLKDQVLSKTPVSVGAIECVVPFKRERPGFFQLAIWSKPDQSDIVWLRLVDNGDVSVAFSSVLLAEPPESFCHMHLYWFPECGEPVCVAKTTQSLGKERASSGFERSFIADGFPECKLKVISCTADIAEKADRDESAIEIPPKAKAEKPMKKFMGFFKGRR